MCSGQAELWDWTTSILKAQVGAGWPRHPAGLGWDRRGLAGQLSMTPPSLPCPCAQHDDLRPVIMRRRSSSDLAKQKFGTMPLVPLHGDSTDTTMLSANQTLVKPPQLPLPTGAPAPTQVHAPALRPCTHPWALDVGACCLAPMDALGVCPCARRCVCVLHAVLVSVAAFRACRAL